MQTARSRSFSPHLSELGLVHDHSTDRGRVRALIGRLESSQQERGGAARLYLIARNHP